MHPAVVCYGLVKTVQTAQQAVLNKAYDYHPQRSVNGPPTAEVSPKSA